MRPPTRFHLLALTFVLGVIVKAGAEGPTFTTFDFPGATRTEARGINSLGEVVGDYRDTDFRAHGFLLSGGVFTSIDFPGAALTVASGINARGDIVGTFGRPRGFLLSKGQFTTIVVPDSDRTFAFGINERGDIVGFFQSLIDGKFHGFVRSAAVESGEG